MASMILDDLVPMRSRRDSWHDDSRASAPHVWARALHTAADTSPEFRYGAGDKSIT